MNDQGVVVGQTGTPQERPIQWDQQGRGIELSGLGYPTTLANEINPVGMWNEATGVNDNGAICGTSGDPNGLLYAVVWHRWSHTSQP